MTGILDFIKEMGKVGEAKFKEAFFGKQPQANPATVKDLNSRFAQEYSKTLSWDAKQKVQAMQELASPRTKGINDIKFRPQSYLDYLDDPQFQNASQSLSQRFEEFAAPKIDWAKRMANPAIQMAIETGKFAGNVGREVLRGSARIGLSLQNPDLPLSMTPDSKLEKFFYGDKQIDSYNLANRKFGASRGLSSSQIQKTLPAFTLGGIFLDAPTGIDDLARMGLKTAEKQVGKDVIKNTVKEVAEKATDNNLLHTAQEAGEAILKGMQKNERLSHLLTYAGKLKNMGFTDEAVNKISAAEAATILKNNLTADKFTNVATKELPIKQTLDQFKNVMKTWMGKRDASKVEAIIKAKEFQDLDMMGQEGFHMIQGGNFKKAFEDLRGYFDSARQRLLDAGISVGYQQNYIPQLWKNTPEEVDMVMGRKVATNTPFSMQKLFKTYEEGIAAGLTPKFDRISDLVGSYEKGISKAIADSEFFKFLKDNSVIKPASKAPQDWVSLSADHFPIAGKEVYKASKEIADHINNYLSTPEGAMANIANFNTAVKNIILSAGIPSIPKLGNVGGGFNTLGLYTLTKSTLSNPNPIKGFTRAMEYIINPNKATKYVEENLARMPDFVKHGGTISIEDWEFMKPMSQEVTNLVKKGANKVMDFNHKYFEDKIFNSILPSLKLQTYDDILLNLRKHLPETEAKRAAAEQVNSIFGGLNQSFLFRNKETQNFLRAFLLAPDMLESNGRIGLGMAKALLNPKDPIGKSYQLFARNYLLHRLSTEVLNKMSSGHWQFQNEGSTNKIGYIETGYYQPNGKRLDIKVPGIDAVRLPVEFAAHLVTGNLGGATHMVQNRLSPALAMGLAQLTNKDYRNRDISNPEDSLPKQLLDRSAAAAGSFLPSYIKAPINMALGKQGALETAAQMIEAPVYFRGGPTNKTTQGIADVMQQGGASGKEVHDQIASTRNKKKLTEEQQLRNLQEGLPIDTERNWLGKPKTPSQTPLEAQKDTSSYGGTYSIQNELKTQKLQAKKKLQIKKIYENLDDPAQISKALAANGIDEKEALYMMASDLGVENGKRGEFVMDTLKNTESEEDFKATAIELAKEGILTTGVTQEWFDSGKISQDQKDMYNQIIKSAKGKSSGSSLKIKTAADFYKKPKLSTSKLNVQTPKLSSTNIKPIQAPKLTPARQLPSMADIARNPENLAKVFPKIKFSQIPNYR